MRIWSMRWPRMARARAAKEKRGQSRSASKASGSEEASPDRSWQRGLLAALAVGILHHLLFPPLPSIDADFPGESQIAEKSIRAPFDFRVPLPQSQIDEARSELFLQEPPVLTLQEGPQHQALTRLREFGAAIREAQRERLSDPEDSLAEQVEWLSLRFQNIPSSELERALDLARLDSTFTVMDRSAREVMTAGVADMLPRGSFDKVWIATADMETSRERDQIVKQRELGEHLAVSLRNNGLAAADAVWAASVLRQFIQPNLIYDAAETKKRRDLALESVEKDRVFTEGELIVPQGWKITAQDALYLNHLRDELVVRKGPEGSEGWLGRVSARALVLAVALGLFGWLGTIHFPLLFRRWRWLTVLAGIMALYLFAAAFALGQPDLGPFAVPIALLALLATVLFKEWVGYASTILAVVLLGILPEVKTDVVFVWLALGIVTVLAVRRIQKRSQFYQTIALLTVLALFLITVIRVGEGQSVTALGREYLVGIFTPVLSVALALFLLPVIEPAVGVCSDLTLLELSDLNHPLLKRMALKAQGTYHHSQVVSQLAEQAARAIGANALLTRAGSLFHDIGKMRKPMYFVENQSGINNKHDDLSPSMSALVVGAHVKSGIELARKWRLPQAVIDFIPEHHGTMVMEYFYHKALESGENETVKVDDYRYPGPKPQSRETAILMLADAVEAAARSLTKPTPGRIKEVTKQIVEKRMLSGELDECSLTLRDLANVRKAFIPLLTGIHHARIAYPGQKEKEIPKESAPERRTEA